MLLNPQPNAISTTDRPVPVAPATASRHLMSLWRRHVSRETAAGRLEQPMQLARRDAEFRWRRSQASGRDRRDRDRRAARPRRAGPPAATSALVPRPPRRPRTPAPPGPQRLRRTPSPSSSGSQPNLGVPPRQRQRRGSEPSGEATGSRNGRARRPRARSGGPLRDHQHMERAGALRFRPSNRHSVELTQKSPGSCTRSIGVLLGEAFQISGPAEPAGRAPSRYRATQIRRRPCPLAMARKASGSGISPGVKLLHLLSVVIAPVPDAVAGRQAVRGKMDFYRPPPWGRPPPEARKSSLPEFSLSKRAAAPTPGGRMRTPRRSRDIRLGPGRRDAASVQRLSASAQRLSAPLFSGISAMIGRTFAA